MGLETPPNGDTATHCTLHVSLDADSNDCVAT